jgi:lysyl-tRNA synthetase class 2
LTFSGIDLTHNPEFTTCEFYRAFTNIGELMHITEKLLSGLSDHLQALANDGKVSYKPGPFDFAGPFKTIDFVPALETALNRTLPDLRAPDADSTVVKMMRELSIELPAHPNLPNLLDCLAGLYLEPQCYYPTFIVNHPECLSPLAKTFNHPGTSQAVAARAELFVNFTEIANMYEEENSPIEQRKKFTHQLQYRLDTSNVTIDEEYLEALEWGLPPTGGWGAGIERLCMLMTGTERIGDLLPFGSLRNVLGRRSRRIG